jgi:O-Antigen ligase/Tetratricopeptide repeat
LRPFGDTLGPASGTNGKRRLLSPQGTHGHTVSGTVREWSYPTTQSGSGVRWRPDVRGATASFALGALGVLGLGSAHGGYFPTSWGWPLVAFAAVVLWVASSDGLARLTLGEALFVAALSGLCLWSALSATWGVASSALDASFRPLVYFAGIAAAIGVVRATSARALLAGVLAGTTAISLFALATRLFPDRIGTFNSIAGYRLSSPLGYWNALGLLCVIGVLVALALATSSGSPARTALPAVAVPILVLTIYFTFSRGSWISLGTGLIVAFALEIRPVRLTTFTVALAVPAGAAVLLASRSAALTHEGAAVARAAHDGHSLAVYVLIILIVSGAFTAGIHFALDRVSIPARATQAYRVALAIVAIATVAGALAHFGGPSGAARRAWDSFAAPPSKALNSGALQGRLFSFSGNGRVPLWRAAWAEFEAHPIAGSGAGSYEPYWLAHRTLSLKVRNAHSLYLETLAELGIVGLALLVIALLAPLVASLRARTKPGVAIAAGAYVAYLVGTGVDWDWQLASVTLAALLVGVALLASARPEAARPVSSALRYSTMGIAAAVGAAGFVFLVGNMFLSRSATAAAKGHWSTAAQDAKRASDWLPWSTAPLQQLGEARLGSGNDAGARTAFDAALAKDPGDWSLWFDLARASTGKAEAIAITRASKLDPLSPEIAVYKSELGAQTGIAIGVGQ